MRALFGLLALASVLTGAPMVSAAHDGGLPPVSASDRILGRADAPVTVVEYASFTCPHCARWHTEVLPELKARFIDAGKVRLVFRDLPTAPAQVAAAAAGIVRCAAPERAHAVADSLMRGQAAALAAGDAAPWFDAAIATSGRTREQVETCLADPATLASIQASVQGANAAHVQGTPSFFVNGRRVTDSSLAGLTAAITPLLPAD